MLEPRDNRPKTPEWEKKWKQMKKKWKKMKLTRLKKRKTTRIEIASSDKEHSQLDRIFSA